MPHNDELQDRVPASFADNTIFRQAYQDQLDHEITRQKIIAVIHEYVGKVEFMQKVKEYAGEEYDNRVLRSARFWGTTALTAVVTAIIASLITWLLTKVLH